MDLTFCILIQHPTPVRNTHFYLSSKKSHITGTSFYLICKNTIWWLIFT